MSHKLSRRVIPEQLYFCQSSPVYIPLFFADKTQKVQAVWELETENGERNSGTVKRNRIQFTNLPMGQHKLTLIVGKPLLGKGVNIYHSVLNISEK
ncbi:hypothetical protein MHD_02790 [Mannheimia granulomatis]|uniref:Uncharacterized protein n=1 Tax=Mannheimia granulomatis TaxID=85402 RepID=A0A011MKR9_9PAST|nr:hypothetical protein [Mannheimia granulomatis]EXI63081.1 hypothetical protein AK33_01365 [Mannheimia granulomatis]RGE48892.1 hypothetical protein MHD_02790 [Mannheimia granulomatis]